MSRSSRINDWWVSGIFESRHNSFHTFDKLVLILCHHSNYDFKVDA